jgi:hypothetical protein
LKNEPETSKRLPFYQIHALAQLIESSNLPASSVEALLTKIFNRVYSHEYFIKKSVEEIIEEAEKLTLFLNWLKFFNTNTKVNLDEKTHAHNFAGYLYSKM